jgi:hypothetical protein
VTQANVAPDPEQTGAVPGQTVPQLPQFEALEMFVSHPWSGLAAHRVHPGAHAESAKAHCPDVVQLTAPLTCGRPVQSWPHTPQLRGSVVVSPQPLSSAASGIASAAATSPVDESCVVASVVAASGGPVSIAASSVVVSVVASAVASRDVTGIDASGAAASATGATSRPAMSPSPPSATSKSPSKPLHPPSTGANPASIEARTVQRPTMKRTARTDVSLRPLPDGPTMAPRIPEQSNRPYARRAALSPQARLFAIACNRALVSRAASREPPATSRH